MIITVEYKMITRMAIFMVQRYEHLHLSVNDHVCLYIGVKVQDVTNSRWVKFFQL